MGFFFFVGYLAPSLNSNAILYISNTILFTIKMYICWGYSLFQDKRSFFLFEVCASVFVPIQKNKRENERIRGKKQHGRCDMWILLLFFFLVLFSHFTWIIISFWTNEKNLYPKTFIYSIYPNSYQFSFARVLLINLMVWWFGRHIQTIVPTKKSLIGSI